MPLAVELTLVNNFRNVLHSYQQVERGSAGRVVLGECGFETSDGRQSDPRSR